MVYVNWILGVCLFPVEAMLWQVCMRNNDHEHADKISTVGS